MIDFNISACAWFLPDVLVYLMRHTCLLAIHLKGNGILILLDMDEACIGNESRCLSGDARYNMVTEIGVGRFAKGFLAMDKCNAGKEVAINKN